MEYFYLKHGSLAPAKQLINIFRFNIILYLLFTVNYRCPVTIDGGSNQFYGWHCSDGTCIPIITGVYPILDGLLGCTDRSDESRSNHPIQSYKSTR